MDDMRIRKIDDATETPRSRNLAQAIGERFKPLGGVDLLVTPREAIRTRLDLREWLED
jgi:hypothetical protein